MHARVTTLYVPRHRLDDALAILTEMTAALRQHSQVQGVTVLADRAAGKLTVVLLCASAAVADELPPIQLKGLAAGEPRHESVLVALHEQYAEAP